MDNDPHANERFLFFFCFSPRIRDHIECTLHFIVALFLRLMYFFFFWYASTVVMCDWTNSNIFYKIRENIRGARVSIRQKCHFAIFLLFHLHKYNVRNLCVSYLVVYEKKKITLKIYEPFLPYTFTFNFTSTERSMVWKKFTTELREALLHPHYALKKKKNRKWFSATKTKNCSDTTC